MGRLKSVGTTRLLWLIGSHYLYLDEWGVQILYWATVGGLFLWALADMVRIPAMVRAYNRRIALPMLREVVATRVGNQAAVQFPTEETPSSSPSHRGLYQAIAFTREHMQIVAPKGENLSAIEQIFLEMKPPS